MNIAIGQKAPPFSLYNSERTLVHLNDFLGKNIVILFFPQAFTSVCTAELCAVRDSISDFNTENATVLGISVDSLFTLARFKADQNLNFMLLSDFNKTVSTAYDVLIEDFVFNMHGVSKRAAFIIDKEGVIQYIEILDNVKDQPDFLQIHSKLSRLK